MADRRQNPPPLCKYGDKCYRTNPVHLAEFGHPHLAEKQQRQPPAAAAASPASPAPIAAPAPAAATTTTTTPSPAAAVALRRPHSDTNFAAEFDEPHGKRSAQDAAATVTAAQHCFDSNTDHAQLLDYNRLLLDPPAFIRDKFLVTMPLDFYQFWQFCAAVNAAEPAAALLPFGLRLVGAFDVLAGQFAGRQPLEPADYLRHWRFFYDPPELQTVLVATEGGGGGGGGGLHWGYWRDDPAANDAEVLVARTDAASGCEVELVAANLFEALLAYLNAWKPASPFALPKYNAVLKQLHAFCDDNSVATQQMSARRKARNLRVVAPTFHKAGLVVPVERGTRVGYRPLAVTAAELRRILGPLDVAGDAGDEEAAADDVWSLVMGRLQPLVTAANIAVDECDFGTAIELGLALFGHGSERLHRMAMQLLAVGYGQVGRPQWIAVVKAHLAQRSRGTGGLSVLRGAEENGDC